MTTNTDIYLPIIKYIGTSTTVGETSDCPFADCKSMLDYGTMEQTKQQPPLSLRPGAESQRRTQSQTQADNRLTAEVEKHQTTPKLQRHQTHLWPNTSPGRLHRISFTSFLAFLPKEGRSELRENLRFSSLGRVSSRRWTEQAYLSTAPCAWADPACRSFCHSRNFFSLSRGERREGNVSVKPPKKNKMQDSQDTWVRLTGPLQIQIAPALNLWIKSNFSFFFECCFIVEDCWSNPRSAN